MAGEPSPLKSKALRRVVVPAVAAAGHEYEREVPAGFRFGGNARDLVELFVYLFGVWEPNLTAYLTHRLGAGDAFIDVGANSGWFSLLGAARVGSTGHVVAVEASPLIAERLRANVHRNRFDQVRVVVSAAGREAGEVDIEMGPAEQTSITRVRKASGPATMTSDRVPCDILTKLLTPEEMNTARVVKIDVEGAEFDVVAGLVDHLDEFNDNCEFVVEVGAERAGSADDVKHLMAAFTDRGFTPYALPNSYDVATYRENRPVSAIERLEGMPTLAADVVFSRQSGPRLTI